ncbi:MAG: TIR domain-containing protein [Leptolyngbyaceae bacterium]|nr:TIR domain-containing protein [Leptolyngbyaceae bacterium]
MQAFQDIFISYGRRDSLEFASRLNRRLVDLGFTVWFDYDDIPLGVDYQKQIDDGIERADNILFVISPHSINSPYCGLELELALKHQKRIIPLLHVEQISYDTWLERNPGGTAEAWADYQAKGLHDHFQNMHPSLRKINWVYVREGQDDFEASFAGLLLIFDRHKEYVRQHTLLLAKALEWERNQKRSPYLLIGEERLGAEAWLNIRFKDSQPPCLPTNLHCEFITESRKNADNLMTEVFLAYADENRAIAEQIRNSLWRTGFTVWISTSDIHAGREFQTVIDRGIEETDNVVYLLSPAALHSPYCQHELDYAFSLNKRIIPVLVATTPDDQIPAHLRSLQYIDLTDNVQESDYQLDESQLLQVLRQDAAYHETHKILLTKALKWERQQQNPTLLLRGYNLRQAEAWLKLAQQHSAYPHLPIQQTFIEQSLRQPSGVSLDVFISYSRADSGFARRLNDQLQMQGKRTWFDQESIAAGTADFQQEIYRGIESADTFLFILSPRSIASPYCADEVEYAAKYNKRFVTLLHQPIDPTHLHPELAKVQWLDCSQQEDDFSSRFTTLLQILDMDSDYLHAHTRLLMGAIAWDEKGRKESLLLRGDELEDAEQWLSQAEGKNPQPTDLQRSYITSSRSIQDAQQQAEQILKKAAAKGKLLVRLGAVATGIGVLVAGVALWRAGQQIKAITLDAKIDTAQEQLLPDSPFIALLKALEAGQALSNANSNPKHRNHIMAILQEAMTTLQEKNSLESSASWISDLAFSPNGKALASASDDPTINLWNMETAEVLPLKGHQESVNSISFSPDSTVLASASSDQTIKLWDVATGKERQTLTGHTSSLRDISFSPNGKVLASASNDQTVKLWDVATGTELKTLSGHQSGIWHISFSPDGKTLVSVSDADDGQSSTLKVWDVETGGERYSITGHQGSVSDIRFSPNGKILATASADKTIKLWDVATGEELGTLVGHHDGVGSIRFSPDGKLIASGSWDKTIKLWDVATGEGKLTLTGHQDQVWDIRFSPDGKTLATASADATIKLWKVATGEELSTLKGHEDEVWSIDFSPDGTQIASGGEDSTIKLWDVSPRSEFSLTGAHQESIWSIDFSPDGTTLASGSFDQTIKLWEVKTQTELQTFSGHEDLVLSVKFSPDGQTLASGSEDHTIKFWDVKTGALLQTLSGHQHAVSSISFSPDGQILASGSRDQTIKLWNVETGKELQTLSGHQDTISSVSFSPDGQLLVSGSFDGAIKRWNVETGEELQTLKGHQNRISSISFSPDSEIFASASFDATIKLWDGSTGELLQTLSGDQEAVFSLSFSADGQTLVSGDAERTLRLWDVKTGELLQTLSGHQSVVNSVSYSPDGKTIASSDRDGTIKFWIWDFDSLMNEGCERIRDYLITHPSDRSLCQGYSE